MAVTARTLRLQRQLRRDLARITDTQQRELVRAWVRAWDEISPDLTDVLLELLVAGEDITRGQLIRATRLRNALEVIARSLEDLAQLAGVRITADLRAVIDAAGGAQASVIDSQLPAASGLLQDLDYWGRVDPRQIEAIVWRSTQQITSRTRALSGPAYDAVRRELVRGVAAGSNPRVVARQIVARAGDAFDGGLTRAMTIARTEMLSASREAARLGRAQHADVLGGWRWLCDLSSRTCPACLARHGTLHSADEGGPDGHPNCLLPGAVVSGPRALASTTRWFEGEVIDIEVAGGHNLTVTPNHPILTSRGWVAAHLLREGDDVVCGSSVHRPAMTQVPDDHQAPALIEDVAESLGGASSVSAVRMPTSPEDFHGDGAGSQVHVVRTDGLLWDRLQPAFLEQGGHEAFILGDAMLPLLASLRDAVAMLRGVLAAPRGGLGSADDLAVLLGAASGRERTVRLGQAAEGHTCGLESYVDRGARDAVSVSEDLAWFASEVAGNDLLAGQGALRYLGRAYVGRSDGLLLRAGAPEATLDQQGSESLVTYAVPSGDDLAAFAGDVVANRVLNVRRRSWSGHVYNLQTSTGWYVANGIVTHNCRCAAVPVAKSWAELGFAGIEEPADLFPDARAWYDALPEADQVKLMGRERRDLLASGRVQWDQLAILRHNDGWRDSWQVTSLRDLRAKAAA